jgi:hypothetical protein
MKSWAALVVASIAAVSAVACAVPGGSEPVSETEQNLGRSIDVPNPSGAYYASVTANGTGCPAGTWEAAISPDGQAFTVTFSGYEAVVEPGQAFAVKDCNLAIDLRTPDGYSFSVSSFHYQGYATLDQDGMSASQSAKYYFRGNPVPAKEIRTDLGGPYDDSYVFSDEEIPLEDMVWSPCGENRTLNALTRITVRNNDARSGHGYFNTSAVDGEVKTVFRFGLAWQQCTDIPTTHCGRLSTDESLRQNERARSCDLRTVLWHQGDGHVVLYHDGEPLWATGIMDQGSTTLVMQGDGNLVQYAREGEPIWASGTDGHPGAQLAIQDDCNLVIYTPEGTPIWSSNTHGCVQR